MPLDDAHEQQQEQVQEEQQKQDQDQGQRGSCTFDSCTCSDHDEKQTKKETLEAVRVTRLKLILIRSTTITGNNH